MPRQETSHADLPYTDVVDDDTCNLTSPGVVSRTGRSYRTDSGLLTYDFSGFSVDFSGVRADFSGVEPFGPRDNLPRLNPGLDNLTCAR